MSLSLILSGVGGPGGVVRPSLLKARLLMCSHTLTIPVNLLVAAGADSRSRA